MNQILNTDYNYINKNKYNYKLSIKKINFFRVFFFISLILLIITIITFYYTTFYKKNNQIISDKIVENYNISRLYNDFTYNNSLSYNNTQIIGFIEISKLNIYYPIFNDISDELLKISPCRFSGPLPNQNGNLCIAGHNYDNYKFFSRLYLLKNNDEIKIYDTTGNKNSYYVFDNYEVKSSDLSPLTVSYDNIKELTLVTCNNFNDNRIIVKAKKI